MVNLLLNHSWKRFKRSRSFSRDTTTLVFTFIVSFIMFIYALALGLTLDIILIKGLQLSDAIGFLNGLLLYFFAVEFIMRYMMQNLPVLDVQPYLHLPLKKSGLVHFLLIRSAVHLLTILPWILFLPFAIKVIGPQYSVSSAVLWVTCLWLCSMSLHYLIVLFKKTLDDNIYGILILLVVIVGLASVDYFGWFKFSQVSEWIFTAVLIQPVLVCVPFLLLIMLYVVNFRFFRTAMYPEEIEQQKQSSSGRVQNISLLQNFGVTGELINVEVKLILRNKRPKNILFLSAFFLLYGLIFYTNPKYMAGSSAILPFVGIFVTGIFMISYGQLLFSWQAGHYDLTLTQPVSLRAYIEAKYWLLTLATLTCFILSTPYYYFGWEILLVHITATLFNIGVNLFIIMNVAMWSPKKIDLQKGATFNHEGVGLAQWILSFPVLLGPYVFYMPFNLLGMPRVGLIVMGLAGLIGIIFRNRLLDLTTSRMAKKRYAMADGFRQS